MPLLAKLYTIIKKTMPPLNSSLINIVNLIFT